MSIATCVLTRQAEAELEAGKNDESEQAQAEGYAEKNSDFFMKAEIRDVLDIFQEVRS